MTERRRVWLVIGLYLLFGLGYSLLMPVWEAPDERAHYGYVFEIAQTGQPPANEKNYESYQPPLYYLIAALPVRMIMVIKPEWAIPLLPPTLTLDVNLPAYDWNAVNYEFLLAPLVLRWFGLVLGALSLWSVYAGVRRGFPDEPGLALGTIALIGGIPQFIHITASVSNDVLAILAGAVLFFGLSVVLRGEVITWPWFAVLAAGLILPVSVKLTVLPLGLTAAAAVLYRIREGRPARPAKLLVIGAVLIVASILLFSAVLPGTLGRFLAEAQYRLLTVRPDVWDKSIRSVAGGYLRSFWGMVGWISVGIPKAVVVTLTVLAAAGFGYGLRAVFFPSNGEKEWSAEKRLLIFCMLALGVAGLMIFRNFLSSPQHQGRFLFPTLGPIGLLIVFGWRQILRDRSRFLAPVMVVLFVLLNLHLWLTGVIPVYYQPFLDP